MGGACRVLTKSSQGMMSGDLGLELNNIRKAYIEKLGSYWEKSVEIVDHGVGQNEQTFSEVNRSL